MRFIIQSKNPESDANLRSFVDGVEDLEILSAYDPIENLSAKVEKLGMALKEYKESGINWKVFKYYLRGRGLSETMIDNVMGKVEDFFKEVGLNK